MHHDYISMYVCPVRLDLDLIHRSTVLIYQSYDTYIHRYCVLQIADN
jgi:hypothetical protein